MPNATVYFATNRTPNDPANPTDFSPPGQPVAGSKVWFGRADFNGDKLDFTPELSDSNYVLSMLGANANITATASIDALANARAAPLTNAGLFGDLPDPAPGPINALFFVHGYNFTFRQSVARAAQLQQWYGKGPDGIPLLIFLFAWPSVGGEMSSQSYLTDRHGARLAGSALGPAFELAAQYVNVIAMRNGQLPRLHLMAHSMGNWALRWMVQSMPSLKGGTPPAIDEMLLMAADEDTDTLSTNDDIMPFAQQACKRVSVYWNQGDKALDVSKWIEGNPERLGREGPDLVDGKYPATVTPINVDTPVGLGNEVTGHQYYRLQPDVRRDVLQVLAGKADAIIDGRTHPENGAYTLIYRYPPAPAGPANMGGN